MGGAGSTAVIERGSGAVRGLRKSKSDVLEDSRRFGRTVECDPCSSFCAPIAFP